MRTETPLVHYTAKNTTVYAICTAYPRGELVLQHVHATPDTTIHLLGYERPLEWSGNDGGEIRIRVPLLTVDEIPCHAAYVLRITHAQ
jgi:alpha-L-fucosidase